MRRFILGFLVLIGVSSLFAVLLWIFIQEKHPAQKNVLMPKQGHPTKELSQSVWLASPVFMVRDADNRDHRIVAAFQFHNLEDAAEICIWMPLIIDKMNMVTDRIRAQSRDQHSLLSFAKRKLAREVRGVVQNLHSVDLNILDLDDPRLGFDSPNNPRLTCDRGVLDGRRSKLFTG